MGAKRRLAQLLTAVFALLLLFPWNGTPAGAAFGVHETFQDYYGQHEGLRVLGHPLTGLLQVAGFPAQYFEKGRIEDHRSETTNPDWAFMYGRLTAELMEQQPGRSVSSTPLTYADVQRAAVAEYRQQPPAGFRGGTMAVDGGRAVFIPLDPWLRPASGQKVPTYFWTYMSRRDLFPGGWLHDIGLPLTGPFFTHMTKAGQEREIVVQAFERTVLTYDARNPVEWQVERGNIGADAQPTAPPTRIEIPAAGARVMLPVHVLARVGSPGSQVHAVLRWQDGTQLSNDLTLLRGEDGKGLLIANVDWVNMLQPPEPPTQPARLEIRDAAGTALLTQQLTVVSPRDPDTQEIKLYWTVSGAPPEVVQPQTRRVLKTAAIGRAALEELLWGPPAISQVGYRTAIPTPEQVLAFPGRQPDWGPRVTLRKLTIVDGVATADFSRELRAYGGGSARVKQIGDQIRLTLLQFPSVRQVRIAIEGQVDALQP